jgi:hypothetical protein
LNDAVGDLDVEEKVSPGIVVDERPHVRVRVGAPEDQDVAESRSETSLFGENSVDTNVGGGLGTGRLGGDDVAEKATTPSAKLLVVVNAAEEGHDDYLQQVFATIVVSIEYVPECLDCGTCCLWRPHLVTSMSTGRTTVSRLAS